MAPFSIILPSAVPDDDGTSVAIAGVDVTTQLRGLSLDVQAGEASVLTLALSQPGKLKGVADVHVTYDSSAEEVADAIRGLPAEVVRADAEQLSRNTHAPYVEALLEVVARMIAELDP